MFSGKLPFYEIEQDYIVIVGVMQGRRPVQPLHEPSGKRGLTQAVWDLVETCWDQDPRKRPTSAQVVNQLRSLPNRPKDLRPLDGIPVPTPSQVVYKKTQHPFSVLISNDADDTDMMNLKCMSNDAD